jgi:ribonuclease VapC
VVVDTSAVVAMLVEPDGARCLEVLNRKILLRMSALTVYETRAVLSNGRRFAQGTLDEFLGWLLRQQVQVEPFGADDANLAHAANLRYGKGHRPAALNFADCAAYALAKLRDEPLLFKGDDFALTDIRTALPRPRPETRPITAV